MSLARGIAWLALAALPIACAPAASETPSTRSTLDPEGLNEGVEVLRYAFAADAPEVEAIAAGFAARPFPPDAMRERLATEGLQAAIVPTRDLETIRSRLGPLTEAVRLPMGQSPTWAEIAHRDLKPGERVMVSGRTMRSGGGSLRLGLRTWLSPDAAGGCAHVEAIVHLVDDGARLAGQPGDAPMGTPVTSTDIECCLQDGESLLVLPMAQPTVAKGPATGADLPPRCGPALLGEPQRRLPEGVQRGFATVVVISARVPAGMRPEPIAETAATPPVDSKAPIADTVQPRKLLGPEP